MVAVHCKLQGRPNVPIIHDSVVIIVVCEPTNKVFGRYLKIELKLYKIQFCIVNKKFEFNKKEKLSNLSIIL